MSGKKLSSTADKVKGVILGDSLGAENRRPRLGVGSGTWYRPVFRIFQIVARHRARELRLQEPDQSRFPGLPRTDDRHDRIPSQQLPQTRHVSPPWYHIGSNHASFHLEISAPTIEFSRQSDRDAAIIEGARMLGCTEVLSEDMNAGQDYGGLRIVNPLSG